jgi:hypothetical protein
MAKFSIPTSVSPERAQELLDKAIHLSAGEKEQVMREYIDARNAPTVKPADKPKSKVGVKTKLGNGVSMTDVLAKVAAHEITSEQAAKLLAGAGNGLSIGINPETGTICVYGLTAKWPVALYGSQWAKLLAVADEVQLYIMEHAEEITAAEEIGKARKAA